MCLHTSTHCWKCYIVDIPKLLKQSENNFVFFLLHEVENINTAGSPHVYIAFSIICSHVFLVVHKRPYQPAFLNCSRITVLWQLCGLQSGVERSWGCHSRGICPQQGPFFNVIMSLYLTIIFIPFNTLFTVSLPYG